jgi:hypothetical protein
MEREVLYPALLEALPEQREELNEDLEEKGIIAVELSRVLAIKEGDPTADAKEAVLSELAIHHMHREELGIFKAAERGLSNDALNKLGDAMAQRFQQILDTGYKDLLQKVLDEEVPRAA